MRNAVGFNPNFLITALVFACLIENGSLSYHWFRTVVLNLG